MLVDVNQNLLDAIGVGHPTITKAISICSEHNLHAKLTGAGGGGCVFALIPPSYPEHDLNGIVNYFKTETNFDAWVAMLGGNGVRVQCYVKVG